MTTVLPAAFFTVKVSEATELTLVTRMEAWEGNEHSCAKTSNNPYSGVNTKGSGKQ